MVLIAGKYLNSKRLGLHEMGLEKPRKQVINQSFTQAFSCSECCDEIHATYYITPLPLLMHALLTLIDLS